MVVSSPFCSLIFLSNSVSFSTHLEYQTFFVPTSLPKPQTFSSWPTQLNSKPETESADNILSLDLHHIDNLSPPPNSTAESLLERRLNRDRLRVQALSARASGNPGFNSSVFSGYLHGIGEYFIRLGIGTPPREVYMLLDTGSDLSWLQCSPCKKCYSQSDSIFDPHGSTSYSRITCGDPRCDQYIPGCEKDHNKTCLYEVSYLDDSFTSCELSSETLTFSKTRVNNVTLGCGHNNVVSFSLVAGILGLSRGKLSFADQIGAQFGRKFSYCLTSDGPLSPFPSPSKPSTIQFGNSTVPQTANFTPMLNNSKFNDLFYYVSLNGISVGGAPLPHINRSTFELNHKNGHGGVIMDSGTSITQLTKPAYDALTDAFRTAVRYLRPFSSFLLFDTCFKASKGAVVQVPTVKLHFDHANMSLTVLNCLIRVDDNNTYCLAFAGTTNGLSIIGNIQQMGFRISFDLDNKKVGFTAKSCG